MLYPSDYWKIFKQIAQCKPDILILSQGTIENGLKYLYVAKLLKVPTISYLPMYEPLPFRKLGFFRNPINIVHSHSIRAFIVISNSLKIMVQNRIKCKHVVLLENWLSTTSAELEAFSPSEHTKKINIALVGRIVEPHKQFILFVRHFKDEGLSSRFNLHIAGDGPDFYELKKVAGRGLGRYIFLHGNVSRMVEFYNNIDVLVSCSSDEGVPLNILEAITFGIPVISFGYPSISDLQVKQVQLGNFNNLIEAIRTSQLTRGPKTNRYLRPKATQFRAVMSLISDVERSGPTILTSQQQE